MEVLATTTLREVSGGWLHGEDDPYAWDGEGDSSPEGVEPGDSWSETIGGQTVTVTVGEFSEGPHTFRSANGTVDTHGNFIFDSGSPGEIDGFESAMIAMGGTLLLVSVVGLAVAVGGPVTLATAIGIAVAGAGVGGGAAATGISIMYAMEN